jgi:tryptophan 2-C-methyltransferase
MQPPVAPLAADYLCEALASRGIRCRLADLCHEGPQAEGHLSDLLRDRASGPVDAVLLTLRNLDDAYFFSRQSFLPEYRAMVQTIRKACDAPVILGGSGLSIAPGEILSFVQADFGMRGAAEGDLLKALAALGTPELYPGIPGLVWRQGDAVRANPASPPEMGEDWYSPRRFVRNRDYFLRGGMVGLETKRGCPGRCRYCADTVAKGRQVCCKPLPVLLKEIRSLIDQEAPVFHVCDSEFNLPREHALAVCRAIQEEGLASRIRWYTYASPAGFDEALALEMVRAGCVGVNFGVDHCNPGILQSLGRSHDGRDLERTAAACRRAGLSFLFDLLLGGPGETRGTLREVIELCRAIDVQRAGANVGVRVYPSTDLAAEVASQGPLNRNPSLAGQLEENQDLLQPVFFISSALGPGWEEYLAGLIGDDPRFFLPIRTEKSRNYNYNENQVLVDAIGRGHRGAFWDILYRLQEGLPPLAIPA